MRTTSLTNRGPHDTGAARIGDEKSCRFVQSGVPNGAASHTDEKEGPKGFKPCDYLQHFTAQLNRVRKQRKACASWTEVRSAERKYTA